MIAKSGKQEGISTCATAAATQRYDISDYRGCRYCSDCIVVIETGGIINPKLEARWERERARLERELDPFHREVRRQRLERERSH